MTRAPGCRSLMMRPPLSCTPTGGAGKETEGALASLKFLQTFPDSVKVGSQFAGARVMTIGEMEKEGLLRLHREEVREGSIARIQAPPACPQGLGWTSSDEGADADEKVDGLTRPLRGPREDD